MMTAKIIRESLSYNRFTLATPSRQEHWLSLCTEDPKELFKFLVSRIENIDAGVISQFVLAGCHHYHNLKTQLDSVDWPLTWIQGDSCQSGQIYSSQSALLSGTKAAPVQLDGQLVGYVYEDDAARYCRLSGVKPSNPSALRQEQAKCVFERMAEALESVGMTFKDTVRTWIYLDRLLDWYDDFNAVRTPFFKEQGVFDKMLPASKIDDLLAANWTPPAKPAAVTFDPLPHQVA